MSHAARLLILTLVGMLLAACRGNAVRADAPVAVAARVIEKPVAYFVPIDPKLRKRCAWPRSAPIAKIFEAASARKACLEQYEAQLDGIDAVQGKPVPEAAP